MQVLIATDGTTDIYAAAKFALALSGDDGSTTVATIIHIPRQLLPELRAQWGEPAQVHHDADSEYVGMPRSTGTIARGWPGDDAMIEQYLSNKRQEICDPLVSAIRDLGGEAHSLAREGTDTTDAIMSVARDANADVIVVGSHGHGAFQGLLGSTGSKLVRRSDRPVLVLR